jgi:peptidoglycan/LPS O-acetylase OafA/YrhL
MNDPPLPLRPLTAFRFLAALAVFLHHMEPYCRLDPRLAKVYQAVLFEGFSGVTFFFVLSGFILTYNYHGLFASLHRRQLWKFYAARFARIYPVHVLTFLVSLPLSYTEFFVSSHTALLRAVANLALVQSFIPRADYYFAYNAPSWSLSNELFFYALLPLLLWSLHSLRLARPTRSLGLAIAFLAAAFALTWSWRGSPRFHWLCYIDPLFRLADFAAGVAIGVTYLSLREMRGVSFARTTATLLEIASLVGVGVTVYYARAVPYGVRLGSYYTPVMAAVILIFAFQRGYLAGLLSARPFWVLGEISFSFYMLHMIVLRYLHTYGAALHLGRCGPRTMILTTLFITVFLSALCHYGFERPMRDRVRRWLVRDSGKDGRPELTSRVRPVREAA